MAAELKGSFLCVPGYNVVLFKTNPQNPKTYVNNTIFNLLTIKLQSLAID